MKKRILLVASVLLVFGLAVVAYAYNQPAADDKPAVCCCMGDSCPMMKKQDTAVAGKVKDVKAEGEKHSCCGDSCPMMKQQGEGHDGATAHSDDHSKMAAMHKEKAEGKAHNCCGDSCPMMKNKKDGSSADQQKMAGAMNHSNTDSEAHTCCACCAEKKDAVKTAAI